LQSHCVTITSESVVPTTPIPAALPLFATGLGALGLLAWRRKRNNRQTVRGNNMARAKGSERLFKQALHAQIADAEGNMAKLKRLADALLTKAQEGDIHAIREVADRIDGKVAQQLTGADEGPIQVESKSFDLSKLNEEELLALERNAERLSRTLVR
jgi:ribosomal protein L17